MGIPLAICSLIKILRSGLPLKMRHKHGAFEIRVGEQNGQERGLRGVSFSGQNPRRLFANLLHARLTGGLETAGFAAPVGAVLCTRRLHNCRKRTGEKKLEGYGLFECAFHCNLHVYNFFFYIDFGNKSTGLTVFTQYIVSYFTFRHSPEQVYRPIRPQSLR